MWIQVERKTLDGYISAISFNNIYYILRNQSGRQIALQAIRLLRQIFRTVPLDEQIIDQAITTATNDFEDAIQAASAKQIHADHIISRNQKDFAFSAIPAVSAAEFLALFQA